MGFHSVRKTHTHTHAHARTQTNNKPFFRRTRCAASRCAVSKCMGQLLLLFYVFSWFHGVVKTRTHTHKHTQYVMLPTDKVCSLEVHATAIAAFYVFSWVHGVVKTNTHTHARTHKHTHTHTHTLSHASNGQGVQFGSSRDSSCCFLCVLWFHGGVKTNTHTHAHTHAHMHIH